MKKPILPFILFVITIWCGTSCKQEKPISYEDALENCVPDTVRFFKDGDTTKIPYLSEDCILGAQLPMFLETSMGGKPIDLVYFTNKVNVINFWFIGCHPCEAEIPGFNALVDKYKGKPVNFLGISRNQPKDIDEFLQENPFNVDQVALGELIARDIYHMTWGYPMTMVADSHGKILFAKSGGRTDSLAVKIIQDELIPVIDGALEKM